jgi:beta-phosphoglucomutase-like phosphatase (HAD superfamily)
MASRYAAAAARFRAVASRMRLRKRNDFGVASAYPSMSMYLLKRHIYLINYFEAFVIAESIAMRKPGGFV